MIWHIFKKDLKLLWPLVAIVAGVHIMNGAMWFMLGDFGEPATLRRIAGSFIVAPLVGILALVATAVHQDALPGDRQDWLVRPIRRRDLIFAKLLFVLATVHLPMLLVDLTQCTAMGLTFREALSAALSRSLYVLLSISLPVLGLATITSTIIEFIGGLLVIFLALIVFITATQAFSPNSGAYTFGSMSTGWLMVELWSVIALLATAVVIPLQYFRRATMRGRGIAAGALLTAILMSAFIPWSSAFAFLQWLSPDPAAAKAVAIAYDPEIGKAVARPSITSPANSVWLPLRISGLPAESIVLNDRTLVQIIGRNGEILYRGTATGDQRIASGVGGGLTAINDLPVQTAEGGPVNTHQLITLPRKILELVRNQPVRVELDYSLSLLRDDVSSTIAALDGDKRIINLGRCKTKIDDEGDDVEIGCIGDFAPKHCVSLVLENPLGGQRNPEHGFCSKFYLPYDAHFAPNALQYAVDEVSFRDPQGLAKYPVDGSQLANAQMSIKTYEPAAHFTRHLIIPEIRLGDWDAATQAAAIGRAPAQH